MADEVRSPVGEEESRLPTVAIYQNPDHVAGILQQIYAAPLVVDETRERGSDESASRGSEWEARGGVKAGFAAPFVGKINADAGGGYSHNSQKEIASNVKVVQNFAYSQAYYLFLVRDALRERGWLHNVTSYAEARDLSVGDFVEFAANFRPNALHALLDILTPELIGRIVEYVAKKEGFDSWPDNVSIEQLTAFAERTNFDARARSEVARAIAAAARVDFRAEKTREFYGRVGDITAVTICDNQHFVVEDEDRILDGFFTVLGKVTSVVQSEVPALSRNKILDRIKPRFVDSLFKYLLQSAASRADRIPIGDSEFHFKEAFDFEFPSRIQGPSFKVIPVAIYT